MPLVMIIIKPLRSERIHQKMCLVGAGAKRHGWGNIVDVDEAQPLACKVYVGGLPVFAPNGKKVMAPDVAQHVQAVVPSAFSPASTCRRCDPVPYFFVCSHRLGAYDAARC